MDFWKGNVVPFLSDIRFWMRRNSPGSFLSYFANHCNFCFIYILHCPLIFLELGMYNNVVLVVYCRVIAERHKISALNLRSTTYSLRHMRADSPYILRKILEEINPDNLLVGLFRYAVMK